MEEKEEYYAVVTWTDDERKVHIVGTLAYFDQKYYFKYEQEPLKKAREKNFRDIASFNDKKKLYISENSLFDFFKIRVSPKVRNTPKAMKELIAKRGKRENERVSVIEIPKIYRPAVKAEIQGLERQQTEKEAREREG